MLTVADREGILKSGYRRGDQAGAMLWDAPHQAWVG